MEENRQNEEIQNQDIAFIKEKVKERPLNRKKLVRRTMITASMAVIFGLIACVTFLVLEPVFSNLLYPEEEPQKVELKEENINEEMRPEDMILEEETQTESVQPPQTVIEKVELEMTDYQQLYRSIHSLAQQVSGQSMVTVTGVNSDTDWFDNIYESQGQAAGFVVADNGKELLILVNNQAVEEAESVTVSFADGRQAQAQIKARHEETGLAIISVLLTDIAQETLDAIKPATLGSSGNGLLATPVIAAGRPLGSANSVVFGMITSTEMFAYLPDSKVRILTTDMVGAANASGVLLNLSGQVVGIIRPGVSQNKEGGNLLTAYGISDLRMLIEKLSNGQEIARMGIIGTDVPAELQEEKEIPLGAYVKEIEMDSPAMEAGIQSGDVIVKLGTTEITSFDEYHATMMNLSPETSIAVTVMRQGQEGYQEMTMDIILGR